MHKKAYISLATLTGLTLGTFLAIRAKKASHTPMATTDDAMQDDYISQSWSDAEKRTPDYKRMLQKWGTREGLMELSGNSEIPFKKKRKKSLKALNKIQKQGAQLTLKHHDKPERPTFSSVAKYQQDLLKHAEVTQVTITNNTNTIQKASLWGANTDIENTLSSEIVEEQDFSTLVGIHPQNAIYNPANDTFYIVNQLSDSVSVLDTSGTVLQTIALGNGFVGGISPVDLSVNTLLSSPNYGNIYVIGSVSNTVYEIDTNFAIVATYNTGKRPIAIAFNVFNSAIYIANLVSNDLTQIDTLSKGITTLPNFNAPKSIGIHEASGNVYVFNSSGQTIDVLHPDNTIANQGLAVSTSNGKFGYHNKSVQLYFSLTDSNTIIALDNEAFTIKEPIEVGNSPFSMAYNETTEQLYVANRTDQTYTLISETGTVTDTIALSAFDTGLAISSKEDIVLSTAINSNSIGIKKITRTPAISFNEEYEEYREDFQHNPAVLQHLRVINSGNEKLNALQFIHKSVTGKETCTTHSFRNYDSPQNFANVSELYDVKGAIIDGRSSWCLNIPANQKITLLLYHKQFDVYDLLPETSRKSIGVQMSKGIPKHWK
ncbi:YncE family protein [uncultured Algibacter sp.]|uniref:YncE family protein n=1 Tax=uncultured Algibacter sp. TaxID=298659 RepID=UPI0032172012